MPTRVWGNPISVTVPLSLSNAAAGSGAVAINSYADVNATLLRTGMFGNFIVYADPGAGTGYPVRSWGDQLEAWVGLWSDGGDSTLTVPGDPFDNPNPTPGWLVTSFMKFEPQLTVSSAHTAAWKADLGSAGLWSHAQRKTRSNPGGTFQTVYFCWVIDEQRLPLPGTASGGINYNLGMDFWFRTLWEIP
jgi:hypothetical protein